MAEEPQPNPAPPTDSRTIPDTSITATADTSTTRIIVPDHSEIAALDKAVSNLSVVDGPSVVEVEKKAKDVNVKVEAVDLGYLVDNLDLTKSKAMELLKANGGNRAQAMKAFVIPATVRA